MQNVKNGSNFFKNSDKIEEGDTAIVYVNQNAQYAIVVKRGVTLHMKYGALRHEFLIGKSYGIPISATAGYVHVLRANPALWTRTLQKKTQILYTPDIATILLLLDAKPGSIICETGTGSGSLTHALATCVSPNGHVYSHDIDEARVKAVQNDIKAHALSNNATIFLIDACKEGFSADDCDSVFLDLPCPWLALAHSRRALSRDRGGRIVSFSPCIEQVQQVANELEHLGFIEIETIEVVPQKFKAVEVISETLYELNSEQRGRKDVIKGEEVPSDSPITMDAVPFPTTQPTHTGYLTSATLLPMSNFSH